METKSQTETTEPKRLDVQKHRLGMGWHHLWRYDPPIEHRRQGPGGTPYYWRDDGETSEGCIMWLADCFARQHFGMTAQEIFRAAYEGQGLEDDWLATDNLRDEWEEHTILPKQWTMANIRKLFEDLEDVNYHSFLGKLIELVEQKLPKLAAKLTDWCNSNQPIPTNLPVH